MGRSQEVIPVSPFFLFHVLPIIPISQAKPEDRKLVNLNVIHVDLLGVECWVERGVEWVRISRPKPPGVQTSIISFAIISPLVSRTSRFIHST